MSQSLHPLYGNTIDDNEIARSVNLPPGVYEGLDPVIAGAGGASGWTVTLGVDSASGRSLWRTAGDLANGRFAIEENTAVQVAISAPDATYTRIDLVVGIHQWVQGPIDPTTLLPTGQFTTPQQATYAVVKGTPSANPVDPVVADPYDVNGNRAVILARVTVPTTGAATVARYGPTDLRLDYMRSLLVDLENSRESYSTLKARLDAMGTATQVQSMYFRGPALATGANTAFQTFTPDTQKQYGGAVTPRSTTTFGLSQAGLYEIMAEYRSDQWSISGAALGLKAWLVYNGGAPIELDHFFDTDQSEYTGSLYAEVYVDPSWTDPYVYFERAGWPSGTLRGSIKYLGTPETLQPLGIVNGNIVLYESAGQTFPTSIDITLQAANAIGATTWSIVSGAGALNGTTDPAVSIASGNLLHIAWTATPASLPATYTVDLQVQDSATPARTATKTITITLNASQSLSITNSNFSVAPYSYPYSVSFQPQASGGTPTYTWTIVTGVDTTLPSAAYDSVNNLVTGSISADGTYSVRLRCTDSASVQVEKVISITSTLTASGGGGGGCVPAGTMFETIDGPIPIEAVVEGILACGYDDKTFSPVVSRIARTIHYESRPMAVLVTDKGEIRCSRDHRPWRKESRKSRAEDPHWPPVDEMLPGDHTLWEVSRGELVEAVVLDVQMLDEVDTVYHVAMESGHVYVAGGLPAHNIIAPNLK